MDVHPTVSKIAKTIAARGKEWNWKPGTKTADKLNLECWIGACAALEAIGHEDTNKVVLVTTMLIATRGFSETLYIANQE